VVLDVTLPVLDGKNVAILVRAIEDAFSLEPTPILFYTAKETEKSMAQIMTYLKNARFLARDPTASTEDQAQFLSRKVGLV
jgi:CheY-like chemotaxis protein